MTNPALKWWRSGRRLRNSLFFKIFLWFWTAMTLAGAIFLAIETKRAEETIRQWRSVTGDALSFYALSAAKDHEDDTSPASREFLSELETRTGISAWLYDTQGHEVSGFASARLRTRSKLQAEQTRVLIQQARLTNGVVYLPLGTITLAASRTISPAGRVYVLVGELPVVRYGSWQARPLVHALRLLSIFVAAGIVCWGLGRHLTMPIEHLRTVAQRLARGDLSARSGMAGLRRRDEIATLGLDIDVMAERIESLLVEQERLVGAQRRLLRDVAHELRSPVARLNVAFELVRDSVAVTRDTSAPAEPDLNTVVTMVDRMERDAARLTEMINRLLVLARLESGVQIVDTHQIDLSALVRVIATDVDFEARSLGSEVRLMATPACVVRGARDLLRSAFENVVRNAARHSPRGSAVEIELTTEAKSAIFKCRDYGPGVPNSELHNIFQPFYRVSEGAEQGSKPVSSSEPHRQSTGSGLGLAISARAIELHGGQVSARNADGGGLEVEIRLPLIGTALVRPD